MLSHDTHPMRHLDREECLALLATDDVGRLAIIEGGSPAIFPVTYARDGESIVFRTALGTKYFHGRRRPVAFEVDGLDRQQRSGWSVVVTGRLDEVDEDDATTLAHLRGLDIDPWAAGERSVWMRVVPGSITGRRVGPAPAADEGPTTSRSTAPDG